MGLSLGPAQVAGILSDNALSRITDPRRRTYLNTHTQDEGSAFFRTIPDLAARKAVLAPQQAPTGKKHLKVV